MIRLRGFACGCLSFLIILLLALAFAALFHTWIFSALGGYLVKSGPPRKADAIVVLAGDDFGYRALRAGKLVREGWAPYALIDGVPYLGLNEADQTIAYAASKGYPTSYFRPFKRDMNSTREETGYVAQWLRQRGVRSILLVTSNFHTRRADFLMRKAAPWLEIRTVAAPDKYFTADGWWKSRGGQRTFLYEWLKTFSAWIGY
jgi:uncharacterized SAM-binding protein YcdF (DUF218 family)